MASFQAYFDESGTHDQSPMVVVVGALARKSSWDAIVPRWSAVLKRFGVTCFHATDLNNSRGEFDGWGRSDRRELYRRLFKVIKSEPVMEIGNAVPRAVLNTVKKDFPRLRITAYQLSVWANIHLMSGVAARTLL